MGSRFILDDVIDLKFEKSMGVNAFFSSEFAYRMTKKTRILNRNVQLL